MTILLKDKVREALTPAECCVLIAALDALAAMPLESGARWRLAQIEHVLLGMAPTDQLDEP